MQYGNFKFIKFVEPRISFGKRRNAYKRALFECNCGVLQEYDFYHIKNGDQKTCKQCFNKRVSLLKSTHKLSKHPLYSKWQDMKKRCYNPKVDRYNCYGAMGIKVCDEWKNSFENFYKWSIENKWEQGLTIERKDVNGNYCPENCCYIPYSEQRYNLKNTYYINYKGFKIPLMKIENESNFKVYSRIYHGEKLGRNLDWYLERIVGFREYLDNYIRCQS